ncbi:MAG: MCP four helix bundle domain-containing protein, partial [Alphaproteobacteria bacterium]|nr:MCP four helix bundle domain-containing protein [Alphaproteobacteria bacterium]
MKKLVNLLDRLSLDAKLLLAIGAGFLITLVVGLSSLAAIRTLSATTQKTYEQDLLGVSHVLSAQADLTRMGRDLRWMAMSITAGERAVARKSVSDAEASVRLHMDEGRKRIFLVEGEKALRAFDTAFATYSKNVEHVIGLLDKGDAFADGEATKFLAGNDYNNAIVAADQSLDHIAKSKHDSAKIGVKNSRDISERSQLVVSYFLAFGLAASLGFGLIVSASIRRPLHDLRTCVEDMAAGRIDIVVPHTGQRNEIGVMANSIRVLQRGAQALDIQRGIKLSLEEIDHALQSASSFEQFADTLSAKLAPVLGLVYGALYVAEADGTTLRRVGGYGCDDSVHTDRFALGQGLVGQAARDRRRLTLSLPEDDSVVVTMGLGTLAVRAVLISPIVDQDNVLAV